MTKEEHIKYWLETAEEDWQVANHRYEKGKNYKNFYISDSGRTRFRR